jgi:uncharacterized protein (TIGR03437 family)
MPLVRRLLVIGFMARLALLAQTASTLTPTPATLDFSYQVNDATLPASKNLTVNGTGTSASLPLVVQVTSTPAGWLTVTPDSGRAPLALVVSVNPTGLSPGSYAGLITVNTTPAGSNPATVSVTMAVRNPPPTLSVISTATNYTAPPPLLTFSYTTGNAVPSPNSALIQVQSSGDTIPFGVTAGAGTGGGTGTTTALWGRINGSNQAPSLKTSGVALSGSSVPITVTVDSVVLGTLNPGSYGGVVTVAANNPLNGTASINLSLVVAAGPPTVTSLFPSSVVASPIVNPTITIYGDNFFSTTVVSVQQTGIPSPPPPTTLTSTLLSRKVLRAVIPATMLSAASTFNVIVTNPPPPSNPSQAPATIAFSVISSTQPAISAIVNSASYLPTATQTGSGANPVPNGATSLSPRELITIFGQNLGPAVVTTGVPAGTPPAFPTTVSGVTVNFQIPGVAGLIPAPIIMVSSNQINAVVPVQVATAAAAAAPNNVVTVTVVNNGSTTPNFQATAVTFSPGLFTFDGLGKGQAAVLNYDGASGSYSINSSKDAAGKSSTIIIYATGLGDLSDATIVNGEVAAGATTLAANTARVDIDGQPAVVTYAGTTPGAVAGLVQLNAIVPPTVRVGGLITITVSVGSATTARRSQGLVTIGVKQ